MPQKSYKTFTEARKYIHLQKFRNRKAFVKWAKSNKKPKNIPTNPNSIYKKDWKDWGDFLGTGNKKNSELSKGFLPFNKARIKVRKAHLKNKHEFYLWSKKHKDIPVSADFYYKKKEAWTNWIDFLGTKKFSPLQRSKTFWFYKKAKSYVRKLKLGGKKEYELWAKNELNISLGKVNLPKFPIGKLPFDPFVVYKKNWKSFNDFLGTNNLAFYQKKYCSFSIAYRWIRRLNKYKTLIDSEVTYKEYSKESKRYEKFKIIPKGKFKGLKVKPVNIPDNPKKVYQDQWRDWEFFLLFVTPKLEPMNYRNYKKACLFAKNLKLNGQREWKDYCKASDMAIQQKLSKIKKEKFKGLPLKPVDIPKAVYNHYKIFQNENFNWGEFLGTKNIQNQKKNYRDYKKAKTFIKSLKLKSQKEWNDYCRVSKKYKHLKKIPDGKFKGLKVKPIDIPSGVNRTYKKNFKGFGELLGIKNLSSLKRK